MNYICKKDTRIIYKIFLWILLLESDKITCDINLIDVCLDDGVIKLLAEDECGHAKMNEMEIISNSIVNKKTKFATLNKKSK